VIDVTTLLIDRLAARLHEAYQRTYGGERSDILREIAAGVQVAFEHLARCDAAYHDVEHTLMVVDAGAEILRGRQLSEGSVTPMDWLHVTLALLYHDIGYVRGVCEGDQPGAWRTGTGDRVVDLPPGRTDASLRPWHVDRGMRFVRERYAGHPLVDAERLARLIDYTRFPVPAGPVYAETTSFRGLCRAADLIGQLGDPNYLRKISALFSEFRETGQHLTLGFRHADDMRRAFPHFFRATVQPLVEPALAHLSVTSQGRRWTASLHAQLHAAATLPAREEVPLSDQI
jgi:hypothetical protein